MRAVTLETRNENELTPDLLGTVDDLQAFVESYPDLFVITGAGISHASGIPTYRDAAGLWKANTPIQHGEFMDSAYTRQRYWARSLVGWPNVSKARPNAAHFALAELEQLGYVSTLLTQNIDRLHQKAGHKSVIDLHGRLDRVKCMGCQQVLTRDEVQQWLQQHNDHIIGIDAVLAPDGDAQVEESLVKQMRVPSCDQCHGVLKPDVVFYGGSVDKEIVNHLYTRLQRARAVLIVGSSLMVYSSFRFCKFAAENQMPMACVNAGKTRADGMLQLKVTQDCGSVLSQLAKVLTPN